MANTYNPLIVTDGLVLALDAGNTKSYNAGISTTAWNDLSGRGNIGIMTNGPTYSSANGGSIVFDGINDAVSLGSFPGYNQNVGSIAMWINPISGGRIFSQYLSDTNRHRIAYSAVYSLSIDTSSGLSFSSNNDSVPPNNWSNITYTYDFNNGLFSIYVNGTLNVGISSTVSAPSIVGEITLGCAKDFDVGTPTNYFSFYSGNISQVSIYNKALTSSEVQQNFNALRGRFGI